MKPRPLPVIPWLVLGTALAARGLGPTRIEPEIAPLPPLALYCKRDTLVDTLVSTRETLTRWQTRQPDARAAVRFAPWLCTDALAADAPAPPPPATRSAANPADPPTPWHPHPLWKPEWQYGPLVAPDQGHPPATFFLTRTLAATRAVTLTIGIGGGDRIELWLDARRVADLDTRVRYERYGTGQATDQILNDQCIVDLPVPAGESRLLARITQRTIGRQSPFRFWFNVVPDPIPHLWQRVRSDFPPHLHALLEAVPHAWFERAGWFASRDPRLEREFLDATRERDPALAPILAPQIPPTDDDARHLALCATAAETARALDELGRLRAAVEELGRGFPARYPAADHLAGIARLRSESLDAARAGAACAPSTHRALREAIDRLRHAALVGTNPLLAGRSILFARRYTYDSAHYYDDYYNGLRDWGGNICRLDIDTGEVREIVPQLAGGIFDRFDLSADARRVVFGYRARKPEGFRLWEIGIDGTGLRQITAPPPDERERVARHSAYPMSLLEKDPRLYGHWTDDMHPCYLPDGRIAFVSTRAERSVLCGGHSLTCTALHRIDRDGNNLREISQGALSEFTPTLLEDGRVLYNRWEYVFKGIAAIQPLWVIRPDGTGSEEVYGDNIDNPGVFVGARQIPGHPNLVVCTGCGHEPLGVGSIRLVDLHRDKRSKEAMISLTPEVETRGLRGLRQFRNGRWIDNDLRGPFYCDPYPLADPATNAGAGKFFLVSCNPHARYNDKRAYGIHLLDTFGNRVAIHFDPEFSCWQPMPLAPRPAPPALPPATIAAPRPDAPPEATLVVADVYRGLDGVKPGAVRYLRVMEQIPRSWIASQIHPADTVPGQAPAISLHTHIWVAVLLGVVPVEPDGSAHFTVPAGRNIFLHALDENLMEIQKMRTFVNFQPGESRSCIGCHEHRLQAPPPRRPIALSRPPSPIAPQPGDTGPRPVHYPTDVQPILDRHCTSCHGGDAPRARLDLAGAPTEIFSVSYENLLRKGLVNFIQEWTGPTPDKGGPSYAPNGSMMHAEAVPPYTYGSHRSPLIDTLRKGHHGVALSREEFVRLVTWVDANAPFYGSYYGRRHIAASGHRDFRPAPTLASARGVPPQPVAIAPIPPELLAWWRIQDATGDLAPDASGHDRNARVTGNPARFDGATHLAARGLGRLESISVTLWARPERLGNRWNPLLFTDGGETSAFHFSILDDGTPNVAINAGQKRWVHHRANDAVESGRWTHLAVTCDPRRDGVIRFSIDGAPAGSATLDLDLPLDLSSFRLGAWSSWERSPANNFHGELRDVRVYRGTLPDAEIERLARQRPGADPPARAQHATATTPRDG